MVTALFPGRFQPPHLAHILTIMKIYGDYDKIIVTISENIYDGEKPQVLSTVEIKKIHEKLFQHLPKIQVVRIGKGLLERENYDEIPKFDVLVSGNPTQLMQAKQLGKKTRFVSRSKIGSLNISSTMLRNMFVSPKK